MTLTCLTSHDDYSLLSFGPQHSWSRIQFIWHIQFTSNIPMVYLSCVGFQLDLLRFLLFLYHHRCEEEQLFLSIISVIGSHNEGCTRTMQYLFQDPELRTAQVSISAMKFFTRHAGSIMIVIFKLILILNCYSRLYQLSLFFLPTSENTVMSCLVIFGADGLNYINTCLVHHAVLESHIMVSLLSRQDWGIAPILSVVWSE